MRFVLVLFFFTLHQLSHGQQRPQFSQFMFNKYMENPGYGGLDRSLSMTLMYRDQYSSLAGNPQNFNFSAHMPFYLWNGAVGMQIYDQRIGVFGHTGINFSYNYVMDTPFGFLSFGARAGAEFINVNGAALVTPEGNYEGSIDHNDPILDNVPFSGFGFSYQAGVYFFNRNIEAGLSVGETPPSGFSVGDAFYKRSHYSNAIFEYKYPLDRISSLSLGVLAKTDFISLQTDVYGVYKSRGGIIGGLSVRGYSSFSLDAIGVIVGSKINDHFTLIYSYDIGISELRKVSDGSHEITLGYNLNKLIGIGLPPKVIYNPRYL